jgi:hypothetical protein
MSPPRTVAKPISPQRVQPSAVARKYTDFLQRVPARGNG